jgi:hypothetical protein
MSYAYSAPALVAAHTAFLNLLDAESGNATVAVRSASHVLLGVITLTDPAGSVNGSTGQLTLTVSTREESAPATGDISYIEVRDGAGTVHLTIPAVYGRDPVPGYAVFNTLFVDIGKPIELDSITIG